MHLVLFGGSKSGGSKNGGHSGVYKPKDKFTPEVCRDSTINTASGKYKSRVNDLNSIITYRTKELKKKYSGSSLTVQLANLKTYIDMLKKEQLDVLNAIKAIVQNDYKNHKQDLVKRFKSGKYVDQVTVAAEAQVSKKNGRKVYSFK